MLLVNGYAMYHYFSRMMARFIKQTYAVSVGPNRFGKACQGLHLTTTREENQTLLG